MEKVCALPRNPQREVPELGINLGNSQLGDLSYPIDVGNGLGVTVGDAVVKEGLECGKGLGEGRPGYLATASHFSNDVGQGCLVKGTRTKLAWWNTRKGNHAANTLAVCADCRGGLVLIEG